MDFGKSPESNDISFLADVAQGVGRIVHEFIISFIKNDNEMCGHASNKPLDRIS